MSDTTEQQRQAGRVIKRLARKNPVIALVVAAVLVVGAAGGWFAAGAGQDAAPGNTAAESASGASAAQGASADGSASFGAAVAADAQGLEEAEVVRVVDGDTLKVRRAGSGDQETVRLVGVDTPESVAADESRNCEEGVIASDYAKSLLQPGQQIWLERDVSDTDKYGRLLRYVWLEYPSDPDDEGEIAAKMLNAVLVREGYAQVKRYSPDTTLHDLFAGWGKQAEAAGKGVTYKWA